jgi:hypothetical protein
MIRDLSKGYGGHDSHSDDLNKRRLFDGFPYFLTRIVPALYDVILLPTEMNEASLIGYSEHQACSNKLDACLVLSENRGLWFTPEGGKSFSSHTPWGGILMTGGLKTCREFYTSAELEERASRLDVIVGEARRRGGYIRGDPSHGGRPATEQELEDLSGEGPGGAPKGLVVCPNCGGLRGECLGTAERYKTSVLPVSCRCDNNNRCARCGSSLHEWKLSSNYFEPSDGRIWYVPGFCCFDHVCPDLV